MVMVTRGMVMVKTTNGTKTYSKTSFKEKKHPRGKGGSFTSKGKTEEESVSYHHDFDGKQHPRAKDGSFSNGVCLGLTRYGSDPEK
jgi:hypothetical protein